MASNDAQASLPSARARPASALPAQQQTSIPPHLHLRNILLESTFPFVEAEIGEELFKLFKTPDDNLSLDDHNHNASSAHNSYLDEIIEGAHRRQYGSPYEMMMDVDKMLEYAQQRIASSDSADRQIDVPKAVHAVHTAFQTACFVNLQSAFNVVKTFTSTGTDQLVGEVMRELELAPGQDPASQKAMQLANARKGITTYFLPGTLTPAPQCAESAYNADTCAKHLWFPAPVNPQLSEPDNIQEPAHLCQLPAENGLGVALAQAQAHKKRGRSDVAHLSRDGSQQRCNKDPASSCSSPQPLHKLLEGPAAASLTSFQDPAVDPQKPKKKRGRPRKDGGYSEKDKKSFDILCKSLEKQKYGINDKGQLDAMWTRLANCKKRPTEFLLKLHNGEQCTSVVQFVSAWKLKWEQINKEKGTGNTKLQRSNPPGANVARSNAAGSTSSEQADIDSGATQHATSNLPVSASPANDQMRPEAARSNPACRPEAADDNAAAQAGPVPVSDTVETQAAKQLLGPAVIHAESLQQLADPSPTGQPLVVNDRSIHLAGGKLSQARPSAVRETGGTDRAGQAENEGLSAAGQGSKSTSELALQATQQDLDQNGLDLDSAAEKLFLAKLHQLIAREGSIRGLPAVKAATEQAAAAVRVAERRKDWYHEQYRSAEEKFSDCLEMVSDAKSQEEQSNNKLLSKRTDYDTSVAKLQAVQSEVYCALVGFCESSGHHM